MPKWTRERQRAVIRRKDGTFKEWKGGRALKDMKKQQNNFHGIASHIGREFVRQHGRPAKLGDIVRTRRKDGEYHKGASWYIKTPNGLRKSPTGTRKPSRKVIETVIRDSRKGRPHY